MAKLTPYDWQVEDQKTLRAGNFTGLVAIEAGGGKSLTATLALAEVKPDVTLIVAPQSTHKTAWIPTLRDNADINPRIIGNGRKAEREAMFDFLLAAPGTYLVTPQLLARSDTSAWSGDFLIVDEVHQVATMGTKAQRKLSGYTVRESRVAIASRFEHRLALSGTPMRQQFQNLWAVTRLLWPHLYRRGEVGYDSPITWMADRMDYTEVYTNQRDQYGNAKKVRQYLAESDPGRLISEMPTVVLHKRRERCCPWHEVGFLPTEAPQIIERRIELSPKQTKAIGEMEDHMITWLQDNPLQADISLTQKQRIRQLTLGEAMAVVTEDGRTTLEFSPDCKSPFVDETLHVLSNLPEDEPVLLFLESQRFAEVVVHQLNKAGISTQEYSGKRKADLSRFGKDYRVLVGVTSSIGTGTAGLNHVAHTEIIMEQPVSLTLQEQGRARLDRLDNTERVQRYVLLDHLGVQEGRLNENLEKQLLVNRSLRKVG